MVSKALIAAIDHYPDPRNNLPSCLADAAAFEQVLRSTYGFTEIGVLRDNLATLGNVQSGLNWLFSGAGPNDRLVFFFSGHGYQAKRGQDLDEVLCLYDQFLFDDALSQYTQSLPPGVFTLVSDSCHSGGMYKILAGGNGGDPGEVVQTKVLRVPPPTADEKSIFVGPAEVQGLRYRPFGARRGSLPALAKRFDLDLPKGYDEGGQLAMNGLLLSACLEDETASASTAKTRGLSAFTFALLQQVATLGPRVSNRALMRETAAMLKSLGFRQTPVLMEPAAPENIADRAFLTFEAAQGKAFSPGEDRRTDGGADLNPELLRVIERTIDDMRRGGTPAATRVTPA